ncbi:related to Snf1p protein kinase interacting protein (SIP3 protein) [Cephalotrichum gorgonifer]|uniref:Related to Snf1p protein kinase interacting protein (SIP3 protein) n=1 Tax=Cephalotrichum gorgonifer TaxID=2041049 RepID=A0AAE8SVH4_9PEZI|nr:related to Snf1p protein kinase interacting protein (SIP3 protein) [Cephalotrichum gorgonifer]
MAERSPSPPPTPARRATTTIRRSPIIPVSMNEAAFDSPSFRASSVNFAEQVDGIERWLDSYLKATSKLAQDILALDESINGYLGKLVPTQLVADTIIDSDYTQLALKRVGDASRDHWSQFQSMARQMETVAVEPIRTFLNNDLRSFRETRRTLDNAQKAFDGTLARYLSMPKTKESSALREDAFAVFEARKIYLKSSLDYCQLAPLFRQALDKMLIRVSSDLWNMMRRQRGGSASSSKLHADIERVMGWSKDMEASEPVFKREIQLARREIGEATVMASRPSRDLEDYSASTVPFLSSRGPSAANAPKEGEPFISERQGWLFLKITTGKPARTSWIRRWFYCRDGIFGWLVQAPNGVLQGDEIGVLLCNAKPVVAEDRRFCFQVKTKSQTMILQAETQSELSDWLEVFEAAKKLAFEASMAKDGPSAPSGTSPAFSITAPMIPEFSAMVLDSIAGGEDGGQATLSAPNEALNLTQRGSFDVNASARRSISNLGKDLAREEGESNREHAARIIQKLDLHRKATFGAAAADNSPVSAGLGPPGGLAGLLAAYGASASNLPFMTLGGQRGIEIPPGTLAPPCLAPAPISTNLSRLAVAATAERGLAPDVSRIMSTAVMANYWGSNPWSSVFNSSNTKYNRLADVKTLEAASSAVKATSPGDGGSNAASQPHHPDRRSRETFPPGYPPELKAQHAQFRLLFPMVPMEEKLVLVFRATWMSSGESGFEGPTLAGNGRIYVTPDNMYFYGHQLGLIVAYSLELDFIAEVTAIPGRDCDFIVLRLNQDMNDTGLTKITVKTFLEDVRLLHARLNLLVDDLQAEEPMDVDEIITQLICLEEEEYEKKSPSVGSWEEVDFDTPADGAGESKAPARQAQRAPGGPSRPGRQRQRLRSKVHLPSSPVVWEPDTINSKVAERHFEVGAKACFHIIFGDDSFIFPRLYFDRDARDIIQGPWVLAENEHMRREFRYKVTSVDILQRHKTSEVTDSQTIEIHRDHVTYVVTHAKRAWHLPHSAAFTVITTIVITHISKTKCKLSIYVRTDWAKFRALYKSIIDRQALNDAEADAEDLAEAATDQVRRLGPRSRTKRAIQVYGHIGRQTQPVAYTPASADTAKKQAVQPRRLTEMLYETARSLSLSAVMSILMWAFAALRRLFQVATAHRVILLMLGLSVLTNISLTSLEGSAWWRERRATRVMGRLGIGPNMMMSKGVYLEDLRAAQGPTGEEFSWPVESACFTAFQSITNASSLDSSPDDSSASLSSPTSRATARRLRRTRQRLASYRHDLIVAMRVVNGVEREVVKSEWENWLVDENARCEEVGAVLASGATKGNPEEMKRLEGVRDWVEGYCGSCVADVGALRAETRLAF